MAQDHLSIRIDVALDISINEYVSRIGVFNIHNTVTKYYLVPGIFKDLKEALNAGLDHAKFLNHLTGFGD